MEKTYTLMDSVHRGIDVNEAELQVTDHPLFQRLQYIYQNDVLYLVFRSANHSRFAHSLGVMHMTGRIFDSITREQATGGYSRKAIESAQYLRSCVRLAALLHDTGHGAFSHQFELTPSIQAIMAEKDLFEELWAGHEEVASRLYGKVPKYLKHEHYSVRVAYEILRGLPKDVLKVDLFDVLSIMETTNITPSKHFDKAAASAWSLIVCNSQAECPVKRNTAGTLMIRMLRTILSGEYDSDKSDYILRDSYHSSLSAAEGTLDTLINNLSCAWHEGDEWLGLVIRDKGLMAFEAFLYSRYQLYKNIYSHKTATAFDLILRSAIDECMSEPEIAAEVRYMLTDMEGFQDFTDTYFLEKFRGFARKHRNVSTSSRALLSREKLKFIGSHHNLPEFRMSDVVCEYAEQLGVSSDRIRHITNRVRFSKINDDYSEIRVLNKNPITNGFSIQALSEQKDRLTLHPEVVVTNFYYCPF
ncbi:HD domain-containing protein [Neptuniibacter sp. QD37_11]|uniref:HD domain-containing protein n=1 Tax=Neptuniibacter sp. QD37_11 TaxID=3398209 RepID=UPI0039F4A1F2